MLQLHLFKGFKANREMLDTRRSLAVLFDITDQNGAGNVSCIAYLIGYAAKAVYPAIRVKKVCDLLCCYCTFSPAANVIARGAEMPVGDKGPFEKDDQ